MSDSTLPSSAAADAADGRHTSAAAQRRLRRRYAAERRFKGYGLIAIGIGLAMLATLLFSIISTGYSAFWRSEITLTFTLDPERLDPFNEIRDAESESDRRSALRRANYQALFTDRLREIFPDVEGRQERRALGQLVSSGAKFDVQDAMLAGEYELGEQVTMTVPVASKYDMLAKGKVDLSLPEERRIINDQEVQWFRTLQEQGFISTDINWELIVGEDSRSPEQAGLGGAIIGSFFALLVTAALSVPIGVAAAVYLEEFAPKNRFTEIIEININNLAAVPSIVYGLLGLAVFLNFFGLPRSAPLVGGLVLTLMTLPTVIIATRSALRAVPPSIREAALGMGASRQQTVAHHVLPLAVPGIMSGTVIGLAQALGETAPLLMIGMVAFIGGYPTSLTDSATVLPVLVYRWAGFPEIGFVEKTSAAIIVLLVFLVIMNGLAVYMRRRFERRW